MPALPPATTTSTVHNVHVDLATKSYRSLYLQVRRALMLTVENVRPYLFPSQEQVLDKQAGFAVARMSLFALELFDLKHREAEERIFREVLWRKGNKLGTGLCAACANCIRTSTDVPAPRKIFESVLPHDVQRHILGFLPVTTIENLPAPSTAEEAMKVVHEIQSQHRLWCSMVMFHHFLEPEIMKACAQGKGAMYMMPYLPMFHVLPRTEGETAEAFSQRVEAERRGLPRGLHLRPIVHGVEDGDAPDEEFNPELTKYMEDHLGYKTIMKRDRHGAAGADFGWMYWYQLIWDRSLLPAVGEERLWVNGWLVSGNDIAGGEDLDRLRERLLG